MPDHDPLADALNIAANRCRQEVLGLIG